MSKARISGYQIELATDKTFTKIKRRISQKGFKKVTRQFSNLNENKKYFIRVRTYKDIKGTKYFSKWSKVRVVK